jgi:hypothetical protein
MATSDKNIVITPNIGQTADPKIVFSGADAALGPQNITLQVYPTSNGTLSFEGSAGQLFSITNSLTGTIFSVNDVSGIPSIEVLDTGLVKLAQYSGNVLLGTHTDNGTDKLQVNGSVVGTVIKGSSLTSTVATGTAPLTVASTTAVTNLNADLLDGNHASAFYLATNPSGYTTNTGTVTGVTGTAPIASSGGTAPVISISAATTSAAGSMSAADKTKLDGIATGATANTGTVTSVGGTGTVSGLTLSGTVTSSGSLTLGGSLSLTSGQVTGALGFTPYNATNPSGYITSSGSITGNAGTATTLQTARTINGVSFNGSADITVADATKLPLVGGTMTGAITFAGAQTWPTFNQNTTGSAATLTTGRTIALTGDVTYTSGSFNGSANVTGTATLASVGTAGTYTKVTTDAKGRVTSGSNPTTLSGYGITDAQTALVSGTNIKTLNGVSLLGSGDLVISNKAIAMAIVFG